MTGLSLSTPGEILLWRLLAAVGMASLGALIAVSFKKISHQLLCMLISFAAGALLAVVLFDIFPETFEIAGWLPGALAIGSGYVLFHLLTKFVFHVCPACAATHTEVNFKAITVAMVVALSVHSCMDGLAIYSAHLANANTGILILIAVAYHKLPEGMALTLVARGSGMSRLKAFLLAAGLEMATTIAGGAAGLAVLVPGNAQWIGLVLGHVGGGFFYIVVHALLSEVFKHHPRSTVLSALAGAGSILAMGFLS